MKVLKTILVETSSCYRNTRLAKRTSVLLNTNHASGSRSTSSVLGSLLHSNPAHLAQQEAYFSLWLSKAMHGNHDHDDHHHDIISEEELLPTPKKTIINIRQPPIPTSEIDFANVVSDSEGSAHPTIQSELNSLKSERAEERKKRRERTANYLQQPIEERIKVLSKYFGGQIPQLGVPVNLTREQIISVLNMESLVDQRALFDYANSITESIYGNKVYFRGIIEFSNVCQKDCKYCGIRKHMKVPRYTMPKEEIIEQAVWAYENHFGSIMLQSGELNTEGRIAMLEEVIHEIKKRTGGGGPGEWNKGLGIALGVGELGRESYQRLYNAGAHRYLLRIETSNPELYKKLHPNDSKHVWEERRDCLKTLMDIGYQTGTGVMIMIPGQTVEDLASDLLFFRDIGADMIGMGPYIVQEDTPIGEEWMKLYGHLNEEEKKEYNRKLFRLSLKMTALARILIPEANISATTALQAINPAGREIALNSGANMVMPIITPTKYRVNYQLYQGKPCIDDTKEECKRCLTDRVKWSNKHLMLDEWGDPISYFKKRQMQVPTK
ncbi:hypothetical protein FDP41_010483 [Naegleria fowleri]|uniref:Radical SAM core domain-containing protein n=1 Tax=Naegleria fowleri TaxID=5763 RepID=A0A6A5CD07_NAEFO|nr:uncharacterized protein FDP41_010483 [Naegleria fowleri]KAF0983418.1 hypothetical protein FDP41_010483 [Naegleria fowleri]